MKTGLHGNSILWRPVCATPALAGSTVASLGRKQLPIISWKAQRSKWPPKRWWAGSGHCRKRRTLGRRFHPQNQFIHDVISFTALHFTTSLHLRDQLAHNLISIKG